MRFRNSSGQRIRFGSGARMNDTECCCVVNNCAEWRDYIATAYGATVADASVTITGTGGSCTTTGIDGSFTYPQFGAPFMGNYNWKNSVDCLTDMAVYISCGATDHMGGVKIEYAYGNGALAWKRFYFPFNPAEIHGTHSLTHKTGGAGTFTATLP